MLLLLIILMLNLVVLVLFLVLVLLLQMMVFIPLHFLFNLEIHQTVLLMVIFGLEKTELMSLIPTRSSALSLNTEGSTVMQSEQ